MESILYSTDKMILHEIVALRNQVVINFFEKVDIRINITQWSIVFVSVQFKGLNIRSDIRSRFFPLKHKWLISETNRSSSSIWL